MAAENLRSDYSKRHFRELAEWWKEELEKDTKYQVKIDEDAYTADVFREKKRLFGKKELKPIVQFGLAPGLGFAFSSIAKKRTDKIAKEQVGLIVPFKAHIAEFMEAHPRGAPNTRIYDEMGGGSRKTRRRRQRRGSRTRRA